MKLRYEDDLWRCPYCQYRLHVAMLVRHDDGRWRCDFCSRAIHDGSLHIDALRKEARRERLLDC